MSKPPVITPGVYAFESGLRLTVISVSGRGRNRQVIYRRDDAPNIKQYLPVARFRRLALTRVEEPT